MRERGEFDTAIEAYEQALERTPWNDRIQQVLAMTYADRAARSRRDGLLGSAESDLRKALDLAPEHAQVKENLATVLLERAALDSDPARAKARRADAEALVPGIVTGPERDARLERKLDLAFELLERGQVEAGIDRLESLHESHPTSEVVNRLLVQALVRHGGDLAGGGNYVAAAGWLDRAVEVFALLPGCSAPDWSSCAPDQVRLAHHNRIVAWLNASQRGEARKALEDAERAGLSFPDLRAALRD